MLRRITLALSLLALPLMSLEAAGPADADTLFRPKKPVMEELPEFPGKIGRLSRITAVDGKTKGIRFALRQEFEITGVALTESGIDSLQGWIIGTRRGGSNLQILRASKTRIVVRPVDIPAAKTTWPASSMPTDPELRQDIRLIIRDDNRPGQDLTFIVRGSFYHCLQREQVCGEE